MKTFSWLAVAVVASGLLLSLRRRPRREAILGV